jgi:hypothetical protein
VSKSKVHQVKERQIELNPNPTNELWEVIVRDFDDNILFSAVYIDEASARAAYKLAYNCIVEDIPLERIYGPD